jgi:hypothetical protein
MTALIRTIIIFILFIFLQGCLGNGVKDTDSAIEWFNENRKIVIDIKDNLKKYKDIEYIQGTIDYAEWQFKKFTKQELAYHDEVLSLGKEHGFSSVIVFRGESSENKGKEDLCIRFNLFSRINFIRESKYQFISVEYILGFDKYLSKSKENGDLVIPLDVADWYVIAAK